jgi:3',5'-cyclic AMP phosphodiesterase CpdA
MLISASVINAPLADGRPDDPSLRLLVGGSPRSPLKGGSGHPTFTLIHLSDPHLSRQFYREHLKSFKLLIRMILERKVDHIVLSGDIVSTGDPDDFYVAREILHRFGLLQPERLTVVPGNHDIFGGPHRAVDILSFPQHIRSVDCTRNLDLFNEAFAETLAGTIALRPDRVFPFVKRVGPLAIIALNSVPRWSLLRNPLGTNGNLEEEDFEALRRLETTDLLEGATPVAVLHHHLNDLATDGSHGNTVWHRIEARTMRMRQRRRLVRQLESLGVKAVFHGHIHRNEIYQRGTLMIANGAGAVCDDPVRYLKFNEFTLHDGRWSLQTRILPTRFQVSSLSLPLRRRVTVAQGRMTWEPSPLSA